MLHTSRSRLVWLLGLPIAAVLTGAAVMLTRHFGDAAARGPEGEANYVLPQGAMMGDFGRLNRWPAKKQVPCPPMDERTLVLLILGQSNAGNHGGQRLQSRHGSRLINFHAGLCFVAASPLLGATGQGGEPWTAVGNLLIENGAATNVILVPVAVSGSRIARWVPGGDLHGSLLGTVADLRQFYNPTHVLWLQGESDFAFQTPTAVYGAALRTLVQSLRSAMVSAPVYVAIASKCSGKPVWAAENNIAAAQRASTDINLAISQGPDLDNTLTTEDRYDGCHLSEHGLIRVAQAWVSALGFPSKIRTLSLDAKTTSWVRRISVLSKGKY